jgi:hypothetical protein
MATRRLELGFEGGTVLRLTVDEALCGTITDGLSGGGWTTLEAEEGTFWIDLGEVLYVRMPPGQGPGRVGFGGS